MKSESKARKLKCCMRGLSPSALGVHIPPTASEGEAGEALGMEARERRALSTLRS